MQTLHSYEVFLSRVVTPLTLPIKCSKFATNLQTILMDLRFENCPKYNGIMEKT